jgi:hypothetical protein
LPHLKFFWYLAAEMTFDLSTIEGQGQELGV